MIEALRNALVMGGLAVVVGGAAHVRPAWKVLPVLLVGGVLAAFVLRVLDTRWALGSLLADAPWATAALLAVWTAQARAGWLRPRGWPAVVLATALVGDLLVASALAFTEPDTGRRARLVLAASGASIVGWTSGAAPLLLGHGGPEVALLGLLLAAMGFVPGGPAKPEPRRPDARAALSGAVVPLLGAIAAWLLVAGGTLEFAAYGLEQLPVYEPGREKLVAGGVALVLGMVADEGFAALLLHEVLARALGLRGDWAPEALTVGLAVGGGLPLLLLTRSRLRVGIPLWLAQAGVAVAWFSWR